MPFVVEPDAEPISGYRLIERLGGGGFGEVWKALAPGGLFKAIKIVHGDVRQLDADGSHRAEQELRAIQRIQSIRHPYLLSIERYDVVDGRLVIVSELADCNLYDRFEHHCNQNLSGIPRNELLRYLHEAAEALDVLNHQYQLQHLDVKPQNLFLIHDHVKVADFGLVKEVQGLRTEITGGVTPVYAAPETFEGVITPFCDQYSLAIVYQELLTGHRPFAGTNAQQLVMQHVQAPPNLAALPHADRPAVAKALAKKPENRHPSCTALIEALQAGSLEPVGQRLRTTVRMDGGRDEKPRGVDVSASIRRFEHRGVKPYRPETPPTMVRIRREDATMAPAVAEPVARAAPPEFTGNGVLFPALVVGLGRAGLVALKHLRQSLCERFGGMSALPHVKLLYIDTDPDTVDTASIGGGGAALEAQEILLTRLTRAGHYLKPRRSGRILTEGWFDSQWLYRIPRTPQVQGQRALGRLAFGDFYATIVEKLELLLEQTLDPAALLRADKLTSLGLRTNRPRAYVITHLGGGTGSGMFVDLAYALRNRLRFFGHEKPDICGLLLLPRSAAATPGQVNDVANAYAGLVELAHYVHPESTYLCTFDDRDAAQTETAPPFSQTFVLPSDPAATPRSTHDGAYQAAEYLVRELTHHCGRAVDERRQAVLGAVRPTTDACAATFGLTALVWPRKALVRCTARRVCEMVIERWARRNADGMKHDVRAKVDEQWQSSTVSIEALLTKLDEAARHVVGEPLEQFFTRVAEPFSPKGWFGGGLEIQAAQALVARFEELLGSCDGGLRAGATGLIGEALGRCAATFTKEWGVHLAQLAVALIEQPEFRMTGAEEAVKDLRERLAEVREQHEKQADALETQATRSWLRLQQLMTATSGRRTAAEFAELAKSYPLTRLASLIHGRVAAVTHTLTNELGEQLSEIGFCRQRLDELLIHFRADAETPPASPNLLLPPGCTSPAEAVDVLLSGVTDGDLHELDRRMQKMVQAQFTALVHVCLSTSNVLGNLEPAMLKLAQLFVEARVGESNSAEMFRDRHRDDKGYDAAVLQAYEDADPPLGSTIGVMTDEVKALSVPSGSSGEEFATAAHRVARDADLVITDGADDVAFYRELPRIPLARLPHLSTKARECYLQVSERDHYPPHTRMDVEHWLIPR